jgi:anti-sigma regulatory factor (Ser/Thr protein kinase)
MGETVRLRLTCNPLTPGRARHEIAASLASLGCDQRIGDIELVISELVTNAVLHASSEVEVSVAVEREETTIEVSDQGEGSPVVATVAADDEYGRGLNLVQSLSEDWGTRRRPDGTTVWCRLRCENFSQIPQPN